MNRVDVLGVAMVSAGGATLDDSWKAICSKRDTRSPLPESIQQYVRPHTAHFIARRRDAWFLRAGEWLYDLAESAIDQLPNMGRVDLLCVGSTTDTFAEIEVGDPLVPSLANHLARRYNIAKHIQFSNACASSSTAIATACDLINEGKASIAIAGGADEVLASVIAAFDSCHIYGEVSRPFDAARKGLVLGEAAAFLILGRHGLGANPLAYIDGIGMTCDAKDEAKMDEYAIGGAILQAMLSARAQSVDFIVAHGTGTMENERAESDAINLVWQGIGVPPTVSYKGSLGHPQGASGAVGVALAINSMWRNVVFPNVGMEHQDPTIHLDIPTEPLDKALHSALVLSHGTWGVDTALLLRSG